MTAGNSPNKFPRYLYKFRHFEDEHHLNILKDNEIFFTSPTSFNDPFDCQIPVRYDLGTKQDQLIYFTKLVKERYPKIKKVEARLKAKRLCKIVRGQSHQEIIDLNNEFLNRMGVFSLSSTYSNLLLWSHYSNSHRGYCIGFDRKVLVRLCHYAFEERSNDILNIDMVEYTEKHPLINPYTMTDEENFIKQLLTKSKEWEYEKEFRMMLLGGTNKTKPFPKFAIKRVIIGCNVSPENMEKLIEIIKARKSKVYVYQAEKAPDKFKLNFKYINLE